MALLDCASLTSVIGPYSPLSIQDSSYVATDTLSLSGMEGSNDVPLCRVQAQHGYGLNNTIGVELWLPDQWNGNYLAVGNGGLAGVIDYAAMLEQVNSGYAVAAGDSGHLLSNNGNGTTASGQYIPFLNSLEQTTMWIRDSMATLTQPTRDLTALYYNAQPKYSYYVGCSTGGAQGFALAQFHPQLFDGIVAGCPGNFYSHLILGFLYNYQQARAGADNSSFLQQNALDFVTNATLDACDSLDGATDRVIEDPLSCTFDITSLLCTASQLPVSSSTNKVQCLTESQLKTAQAIYAGPVATDGTQIYPGFDFGSESSWLLQESLLATAYTFPILQNLVFKNLSYDVSSFDFNTDVARVNASASPYIDSISPDLSAYKARGGKMIVTQGWADPYNAGTWPIDHLNAIDDFLVRGGLGSAAEFMKLFMIPGGGHCGSSPAYPYVPAKAHSLESLVQWVEKGQVPVEMLADNPADGEDTSRKLCAWPMTARLKEGKLVGEFDNYECHQS